MTLIWANSPVIFFLKRTKVLFVTVSISGAFVYGVRKTGID